MSDIKVSLIIPVYNVEKYIRKCLVCAVNQTLKDIEIIVVNDGSTDKSLKIINTFKNMHPNFIVINQENMGLSAARNNGLKLARGNYVAFADSDDYFDLNFLKLLYEAVKKNDSDIGICKYKKVRDKKTRLKYKYNYQNNDYKIIDSKMALKQLLMDLKIKNYAWNKIYKKELFINNNIFFPEGRYFEDLATTYKLFFHAKNIVLTYDRSYYYLQRKGSITRNFSTKHGEDIILTLDEIKTFLVENEILDDYKKEFAFLCFKNYQYLKMVYIKKKYDNQEIIELNENYKRLTDI